MLFKCLHWFSFSKSWEASPESRNNNNNNNESWCNVWRRFRWLFLKSLSLSRGLVEKVSVNHSLTCANRVLTTWVIQQQWYDFTAHVYCTTSAHWLGFCVRWKSGRTTDTVIHVRLHSCQSSLYVRASCKNGVMRSLATPLPRCRRWSCLRVKQMIRI